MITELYDALREAGASEDKARRAAEALANYDVRFAQLDQRFTELRGDFTDLRGDFTGLRGEMTAFRAYVEGKFNLLTWMVGFFGAVVLAVFVKLFVHG